MVYNLIFFLQTILMTRPRVVVVELCVSRLNILRYDEKTILEEAKNLNMGNKKEVTYWIRILKL